jgi:hypothetical protein
VNFFDDIFLPVVVVVWILALAWFVKRYCG